MKKLKKLLIAGFILSLLNGCNAEKASEVLNVVITAVPKIEEAAQNAGDAIQDITDFIDIVIVDSSEDTTQYTDSPYCYLNDNVPNFSENDYATESYEFYSDLDSLGRCGTTMACIGQDIMPTEARGQIGQVKPTGWHTVKYDCITDGMYLYNRCHLIGYQLTGENANEKNLITGTRYLNVEGMLPFENMVADYVEETGNHVLYRVTPIYTGNNLIADGVQMEAYSIEDNGEGICFNVFCYNVQPGVCINYETGDSWEE